MQLGRSGPKMRLPDMCNRPDATDSAQTLEGLVRNEQDAQIQRRYPMLLLLKTGAAKIRRQLDQRTQKKRARPSSVQGEASGSY
jgi:hypothetical protein